MIKKIATVLLLIIVAGQFSVGQTKVYSGNFNSSNFQGNASYNYIEQSENRVFSGPFAFTNKNKSIGISGSFKDNLKDGLWKFTLTNVYYEHVNRWDITANVIGNFKDGNIDGIWNLTRIKSTVSPDNKKIITNEKSTANFKNNHFAESFSYNDNSRNSYVKGTFDDKGYFDGIWTVGYYENGILNIQTRNYKNGIIVSIKNKNSSTGEVKTIYDKTFDTSTFLQNYDSLENISKVGDTYYKLGDRKTENTEIKVLCENYLLESAIDIWYNNSYFPNSAYLFEIEKGTNRLSHYPEREIIVDKALTDKFRLEEETRKYDEQKKIEEEKKEQREIAQEKIRQEKEQIRKQQEKERRFENSDLGRLQKSIKVEFMAWIEKGRFETQEEFEKRVKLNYQSKFDEIVKNQMSKSKERKRLDCLECKVGEYNIEKQSFKLKVFLNSIEEMNPSRISINIPKGLAQTFAQICEDREASKLSLLIVNFLDYSMIDDNWEPSSALVLFDNSNYTRIHSLGLEKSQYRMIKESDKKQYRLSIGDYYKFNIINIQSLNENETFEDAIYYYKWDIEKSNLNNLDFTIEKLGITLPF